MQRWTSLPNLYEYIIMHVQLSQGVVFQHNFRIIIFPPCHRNDMVFISCGLVYPYQGLLGSPLLGSIIPKCGTYIDKLPSHPVPHVVTISFFFSHHHPSPSFNHIFKFTFKYMKSPLFISKPLCLNHQTHSS